METLVGVSRVVGWQVSVILERVSFGRTVAV